MGHIRLVYLLILIFAGHGITSAATPTCKKIDDCSCIPMDTNETGVINFFPLANATGAKPMFSVNGTSQQTKFNYTFNYNPCIGFNVTGATTESPCINDLLCQTDIQNKFVYNIGARNHTRFAYVDDALFAYYYSNSSVNRTSEVRLICDESETHGKFVFIDEPVMLYYRFNFTSVCACPGKCPNKTEMMPDKWMRVANRKCTYKHARSGRVMSLQGLDTPLKVAVDDYTTYYYDPCNGLKLGNLDDVCEGVAVCQQDMSTSPPTFHGIGNKEPEVTEEDGRLVLHYPGINGGQGFDVKLICDQSADESTFTIFRDKLTVKSKNVCPQ